MPGDEPFEDNAARGADEHHSGKESVGETAEDEQISRHAFHSTWEEIYQRELHNAAARKAYQTTVQYKRSTVKSQAGCRSTRRNCSSRCNSSSRSRSSSMSRSGGNSDRSSDSSSIDGEEWFAPECGKILSWVLNTLRRPQNHPLQLYFRRAHALRNAESPGTGECRGGACDWCRGEGPLISQEFTEIPVLDVGCGGGQFLARLRRCGLKRLAGIDYSQNAIQLARSNLYGEGSRSRSCNAIHICLRQADLRHLRAGQTGGKLKNAIDNCICCCSKTQTAHNVSAQHETAGRANDEGSLSPCSCEPATSLPPFPVVFDKGTFDVFWLMRTPELYGQCMHRLMPQYGILFLTSCNCTVDDLDSLFCEKTDAYQEQQQQQQQAPTTKPQRENQMPAGAAHPAVAGASGALAFTKCRVSGPEDLLGGTDERYNRTSTNHGMPFFERLGLLPHRSFKFGGVEGQVVTSVLLRRL